MQGRRGSGCRSDDIASESCVDTSHGGRERGWPEGGTGAKQKVPCANQLIAQCLLDILGHKQSCRGAEGRSRASGGQKRRLRWRPN